MKYFGITETGDPCFVPDWDLRLREANIIISKELTEEMIEKLIQHKDRIIFHHTVTGLGGSIFEPEVNRYEIEMNRFRMLIHGGFPLSHYVLRIDPIIPYYEETFDDIRNVLEGWKANMKVEPYLRGKGPLRCRFSILDGYNHVKDRFKSAGLPYVDEFVKFTAPIDMFKKVENFLEPYKDSFIFECCGERDVFKDFIQPIGCASYKDVEILGLNSNDYIFTSDKQRAFCHCLPKKQILGIKPERCKHQCLYCFWKD